MAEIPIIDIAPLITRSVTQREAASAIGRACRDYGFFYIIDHGVDKDLQLRLVEMSREFFAQDMTAKMSIAMTRGGRAWRGYFPVGGELTSGTPDLKEGIYFGTELGDDDPRVKAGTPLHGANLFPATIPRFRETILEYMDALTALGHVLMRGIAMSLGLDEAYFSRRYTTNPLVLFRIFNYPASDRQDEWGVGEHTDYGLLTILKQDDTGGLEVKSGGNWIDAPPIPGSFVCNIGDMLDRMTSGLYHSTPHRVRNLSGRDRLSFPFFFDPGFDAVVDTLPLEEVPFGHILSDDRNQRWDCSSLHEFRGTYGEYLLNKVSKVFPQLRRDVLDKS
jgi:isopenicillin N synthase-like dioxygenase